MHRVSIYAKLRVKYSRRANCSPRVARPWRPRAIAWAGPDAFSRDRFYELDSWYKARIQKPELLPKLHVIDPDLIVDNYADKIRSRKERTIDIGFKRNEIVPNKMTEETKNNLEELAVMNQLLIDLDAVESSNQLGLAEHFSVFEDLFMPGVFFHNVQSVEVIFGGSASREKMLFGNTIRASTAAHPPVEVQRKRLEKLVKLKPGEKLEPEPYPDIDYMKNWSEKPFFEHERLMKENVGEGVWAALYSDYENPMEQHDMAKYRRTKETEPPVNIFV
uniref:39S ribosomal protein L50, mitochondrial n=1 Tax=Globodera pallida TaxID=36090 RepID=A0A183CI05_GLOPA